MRTDDLIDLLATDPIAPQRHVVWRRLGLALVFGFLAGAALVVARFGAKDLFDGISHPTTLRKAAFVLAVTLGAGWTAARLARPGVNAGAARLALAAPFVAIALWGVAEMALLEPHRRLEVWLGWTWWQCPLRITAFAAPAFAASVWAMRGLAPTHLRAAGAASGLFAGAVGALAYVLYCREPGAAYLATWYPLGLAIPTLLGAALGPRLLRW